MKTVLKVCGKCGFTMSVRPRVRKCRRQPFGPRSYWCYGPLTVVPVKPKPVRVKPSAVEVWERKLAAAKKKELYHHEILLLKSEAMGRAAKNARRSTAEVVRCQKKLTEAQHALPRIRRGIEL